MKSIFFIPACIAGIALTGFVPGLFNKEKTMPVESEAPKTTIIKTKSERTRRISTEEYQFALTLFQREFTPRDQLFISDETGVNGAFYVRPTIHNNVRMCMGKYFDNCLASAESKSVFAHELTHAWQIEHYGLVWFGKEAFCNQIVSLEPYTYACDVNKTIGDYNAEQQGEIVRHYYGGNACAKTIAQKTLSSSTWKLLIGSDGRDAAIDNNGVYYMINNIGLLYKYETNDWKQLPGSDGYAISANAGKVWFVNTAGLIYSWENSAWKKMTGSDAKDIAIASDGTVWMVNTAGKIYTYVNAAWKLMPGSDAARISAGNGKVWMVNSAGLIYEYVSGAWVKKVGSDGRDIAVSNDGKIFMTNSVGGIYQWSTDKWVKLDGSDGRTIAANKNKVFMVNTIGRLFYRSY